MNRQELRTSKRPRLEPLLKEREVAKILGVSVRTLQERRRIGDGPPYLKLSRGKRGVVRSDPVDVRSFMKDRKIRRNAE